jgi:hypothetical protein
MLARIVPLFALITGVVVAETATRAIPVHASPNAQSAVLQLVKGGETIPETDASTPVAAGWTAVSLPGPHEVFVENRFIGKDLSVKPGSPLRTSAKSDAPILSESNPDDVVEITGLRGRWTQLRIAKSITGYIQRPDAAALLRTAPEVRAVELRDTPSVRETTNSATNPSSRPIPQIGQAVTRTAEERGTLAALPRLFEGRLKSTRVALRPRRPYDYALETEEGVRFAYVDLTNLLLTEQIENYLHRSVVVYGVARPIPDTKDIVITVESFQLR